MKIAQGDKVLVIAGKDRGKTGSILRVLLGKNRVVITGVNMRTKHIKKTVQQAGQKIHYEASVNVSNVMIIDPQSGKRSRIGYSIDEKTKKKVRIARKTGATLTRSVMKSPKAQDKKTGAEVKEDEKKTVTKEETTVKGVRPTKTPFWKKLGFGADALNESEDPTPGSTPGSDDSSHPSSQAHVRTGTRGS